MNDDMQEESEMKRTAKIISDDRCHFAPYSPYRGVAGITPEKRKDGNDDEHETKRRCNPAAHEKPDMG